MLPAESSMKSRYFDHIDLRVRDMERARKFYVPVLAALGFTVDQSSKTWVTYAAPGTGGRPTEFFGFTRDPNHVPNGTRVAFWAETRDEVNRVAEVARAAGAKNIEGPELCAEYEPNYYAVFFEDPEGNKLEVCCHNPSPVL
jgi:catechol 2,3-dioxygenase-like lactoylglutathione lyase family enzyme